MVTADYINGDPYIDIKAHRVSRQIVVTIGGKTGEIEISLDWKDAEELYEALDKELHDETAQQLSNRLDDANATIDELKEKIEELTNLIEVLEERT
jgi:prefoldin subunit 5